MVVFLQSGFVDPLMSMFSAMISFTIRSVSFLRFEAPMVLRSFLGSFPSTSRVPRWTAISLACFRNLESWHIWKK